MILGRFMIKKKIQGFLALTRIWFITLHFINTITAAIMLSFTSFLSNLGIILLASLLAALLDGIGVVFNAITDLEIDRINIPNRPLPSGIISISTAKITIVFYSVIAVILCFFFNLASFIVLAIGFFVTISYSLEPIRWKKRHIFSPLMIGVGYGLEVILVAVIFDMFNVQNLLLSLIVIVFVCGIGSLKEFPDIEGDRKGGVNSVPIVLGIKNAKILSGLVIFLGVIGFSIFTAYENLFFVYLPFAIFAIGSSFTLLIKFKADENIRKYVKLTKIALLNLLLLPIFYIIFGVLR